MVDLISLHRKRLMPYPSRDMAEVHSTFRLKPGELAPAFELPEPSGTMHSWADLQGEQGTLVIFACNHCPYVIHLAEPVGRLAEEITTQGLQTVAIMPNDVENYPDDHPDKMGGFASENGWGFPYLFDESQEVAKAWGAACTPDFFLLDSEGRLFYTGQFDSSRPKNDSEVTGADLRQAIDGLLNRKSPPADPFPSSGCNIKWKAGNEPPYFG